MPTKVRWIGWALAGILVLSAGSGLARGAGSANAPAEDPPSASSGPALDGAKVYAWNCGSCHSERWPKERTDAEWRLIVTHMRVRANLTAEQAEAVRSYLQASN